MKVTRLGSKAVVFGMGVGDDKTNSFDVAVKDYISESSLPFAARRPSDDEAGASEEQRRKNRLQDVFISPGRLADLAALFKLKVIQRVIPGLQKEGYDETAPSGADAASASETQRPSRTGRLDQSDPYTDPLRIGPDRYPPPARPFPFNDPLADPPRRPHPVGDFPPPGFEDEYEMNRPPRAVPLPGRDGRNPLDIGHDDLYPPGLGPHDPLRGTFIPGGGLPRPGGGGGMHPTFDDPLFGGRRGGEGGYDPR